MEDRTKTHWGSHIFPYGGFLKWGYPQIIHLKSFEKDFPYKPSSYWGTPIDGNPHMFPIQRGNEGAKSFSNMSAFERDRHRAWSKSKGKVGQNWKPGTEFSYPVSLSFNLGVANSGTQLGCRILNQPHLGHAQVFLHGSMNRGYQRVEWADQPKKIGIELRSIVLFSGFTRVNAPNPQQAKHFPSGWQTAEWGS